MLLGSKKTNVVPMYKILILFLFIYLFIWDADSRIQTHDMRLWSPIFLINT